MKINNYLEFVYENDSSDLHLKAGNKPCIRKNGLLSFIGEENITDEDILEFVNTIYPNKINTDSQIESYDFSFYYKDVRFRANLYHDINGYGLALRQLKLFSTDFDVLGLPEKIKEIVNKPNGLILFTGPTGSGKSTSLAAVVNYLNNNSNRHIITVEDPIEYIYKSNKCLITQREVGKDTKSFSKSISEAMREDPDILIIGEMRDKESIEAALVAAETGHLVLSTLHTKNASSTITRLIDMFEADKQNQILSQLSATLLAIVSQQLLPNIDCSRRYLATEFLIANNPIRSNIKSNKIQMVSNMVALGKKEGMHTMSDSLEILFKEGKISEETFTNISNTNI